MNEEQWKAMYCYFANWMNMASVGCILAGLFQPEHMFGGFIGAVVCGLTGMVLKI